MQIYKTPLREFKFLIDDFLNLNDSEFLKKQELETSDLMLILEEASKLCEETLLPLNQSGDSEGCKFDNGNVTAPKGFKEAYKIFSENGNLLFPYSSIEPKKIINLQSMFIDFARFTVVKYVFL